MKRARPHQHIRRTKGKRVLVNRGVSKRIKRKRIHTNYSFWPFDDITHNPKKPRKRYNLDDIQDVDELRREYEHEGKKGKALQLEEQEDYLKTVENSKHIIPLSPSMSRPVIEEVKKVKKGHQHFFFTKKQLAKIIFKHKRTIVEPHQSYFEGDIEKITDDNNNFRKVIYTAPNEQLVAMSIPSKDDIGNEVHKTHDQFFRIEQGEGELVAKNKEHHKIKPGTGILIPKGTWHDIKNTGKKPLKLYTIYSPPNHPDGTIDKTKKDAIAREKHEKK